MNMRLNWPELTNYCGCLSVNTGIYIGGIVHIIFNFYLCIQEIQYTILALEYNRDVVELIRRSNFSDHESNFLIDNGFILIWTHFVAWITIQIILFVSMVVLLYGVYKVSPKVIKFYIYLNVPGYIFFAFFKGLDFVFYGVWARLAAVFFTLLGVYQLIASRSVYRKLTGKTTVLETDSVLDIVSNENSLEGANETVYTFSRQPVYRPTFKHCRTCSCNTPSTPSSETQTIITPAASSVLPETSVGNLTVTPSERTDDLDPKEQPTVFDESQLVRRHQLLEDREESIRGSSGESSLRRRSERATTMNLVKTEQEKRKLEDQPVIYDENQLNVGSNSIIHTDTRMN